LALKESDLLIGFIMIKALSPNTGIDRIKPVIIMASITAFSPMSRKTRWAMTIAPPVFSRNVPIMTPRRMRIPILPSTLPKPSLIDRTISGPSIPASSPYRSAPTNRARNGWMSNFMMATRMRASERMTISKVYMSAVGLVRVRLPRYRFRSNAQSKS
jgi:hypothetical protein